MKEKYQEAEIEVVRFNSEDIITTSGGDETPDVPFEP